MTFTLLLGSLDEGTLVHSVPGHSSKVIEKSNTIILPEASYLPVLIVT